LEARWFLGGVNENGSGKKMIRIVANGMYSSDEGNGGLRKVVGAGILKI
jgi:hypothetical protein